MEGKSFSDRLNRLELWLSSEKHKYESMVTQLDFVKEAAEGHKIKLETLLKAKSVIVEVQDITLKRYKEVIESLVTLALNTVFERPYKFILLFLKRKEIIECFPMVQEGDQEPEYPKDESGVGLVDMISFAFRVVMWSLERPRRRPVFYLDEPFKALGESDDLRKAIKAVSEIATNLGIQLIINTHSSEIAAIADRAWLFVHDGKKTNVTMITEEIVGVKKRTKLG